MHYLLFGRTHVAPWPPVGTRVAGQRGRVSPATVSRDRTTAAVRTPNIGWHPGGRPTECARIAAALATLLDASRVRSEQRFTGGPSAEVWLGDGVNVTRRGDGEPQISPIAQIDWATRGADRCRLVRARRFGGAKNSAGTGVGAPSCCVRRGRSMPRPYSGMMARWVRRRGWGGGAGRARC